MVDEAHVAAGEVHIPHSDLQVNIMCQLSKHRNQFEIKFCYYKSKKYRVKEVVYIPVS